MMEKTVEVKGYDKSLISDEFIKRLNNKKLSGFNEYKTLAFSIGATAIFTIIFALNIYSILNKNVNKFFLYLSIIYSIGLIVQLAVFFKLKTEILENNEVKKTTRLYGFLMMPFVLCGNFFMFAAGFSLIKKETTIEYQLCTYMILTNICIILISMINIFKEYVASTFLLGIGLLGITLIFYIIATILISKNVTAKTMNNKILWLCIPLLISGITGNAFAIILAIVLFNRYTQRESDTSIKWVDILRRLFKNQMAVTGCFIVVLLISLSICSNLTFEEAVAIENDYSNLLVKPSIEFPFGTDEFGRCVFTRIIFGARISLLIGLLATAFSMVIGATLGAFSGYYGGKLDNFVMRGIDILHAIPGILLSMVIIAGLGANIPNLIIALGISSIPSYARITRSTVLHMANLEFVEAARACGANDRVIIFKHILLNSMAPIIVNATIGIGSVVLATSALSYLGIGIPPHIPEWGNVLRMGSEFLETKPYLAIFPGLAIMTIVLAFNFFGDGLRDALDPKMK